MDVEHKKEQTRLRKLKWQDKNKEKLKEIRHQYYLNRKASGKAQEYELKIQEHKRRYNARRELNLKMEILTHYSNGRPRCNHCGFDDIRALQIDHINGGGAQHRMSLVGSRSGSRFYIWLKKNDYPEDYQVLCANCNWIKRVENRELYRFDNSNQTSL